MDLTIEQKGVHVLAFLRGVTRPRAAELMAGYGFTQADLDEGWELLRQSTGGELGIPRPGAAPANYYEALDAWEHRWFPVAKACLDRHFPDVSDCLFRELTPNLGLDVLQSVATFVGRIRQLGQGTQDEQRAVALLDSRGLTDVALSAAEELLAHVRSVAKLPPVVVREEDLTTAEGALWAWYVEWSTIARRAVHDAGLLAAMGFAPASDAPGTERPSGEHRAALAPPLWSRVASLG